jgi:putative ABC transport system permease protein
MKAVHKVIDVVRLGLTSLTVHKVRSALTALGIIIGVCGVMASLAINEGMMYQSQQAFRDQGTDNIVINSRKPIAKQNETQTGGMFGYGLTRVDVTRLADMPKVKQCVMVHRSQKYAHVDNNNMNVYLIATDPVYAQVARIELSSGRFINALDMENKPHCVITDVLAGKLFGIDDPLGKTIRLADGDPLIVVGTLSRLPANLAGEGGDNTNCIIAPLTTCMQRFGPYNFMRSQGSMIREKVDVSQVILQMQDEQAVVEGASIARALLQRFHEKMDFEVIVPLEQIRMMKEQKRLLTLVSLGIAAISLVVGGIGIMNIMLASVTERTREIGIRRALGAKRRDIVIQFLVEAVALTMAGGLIGIVAGLGISTGLEKVLTFKTIITTMAVVFPFAMAVAVGLISGLYPALRAASLDPISALRHE